MSVANPLEYGSMPGEGIEHLRLPFIEVSQRPPAIRIPGLITGLQESMVSTDTWGGVTDPKVHDPDAFRYLVHGLSTNGHATVVYGMKIDIEEGVEWDGDQGDQRVNLYDYPERITERVSLSTSLIDQSHRSTWGDGGLIIHAHPSNIAITSPGDNGTRNNNLGAIRAQAKARPILAPENLLAQTKTNSHNEVVVVAKQGEGPLEIAGFFIKTDRFGEPLNQQLAEQMRSHAIRLKVPLVPIVEKSFYNSDRVDLTQPGRIAIEYRGNRYSLIGFDDKIGGLTAYDSHMRPYFPGPSEVEDAVNYALSSGGIGPELAKQILDEYAAKDKMRQTPTVYFREDGSVDRISYKKGYGSDEEEIILGSDCTGQRINIKESIEKVKNIGISQSSMGFLEAYKNNNVAPISPNEADDMIQTACVNLDAETRERVMKWYSENRPNLERQWEYYESSRRGTTELEYIYETKLIDLANSGTSLRLIR